MVDKNLFLHDLAIVAILKNEGPYLKEWLDYHLLAGVDHFYLYDNDSTDNQAEVAAPYVGAGLVDYIPAPGKAMQYAAYNDAVNSFKFQNRYMAFIDADEFIFPKTNRSVVEVIDEIFSAVPNAAGVAINWQMFGSSGEEKADFSRGVLERFTHRAPVDWTPDGKGNACVKTVANPRKIKFIAHPHFPIYFNGNYSVNEVGKTVPDYSNDPVTAEKIVINHYYTKSREEYAKKVARGAADRGTYKMENFFKNDNNEVFDDDILKYRAIREEKFSSENQAERLDRVTETLTEILFKFSSPDLPRSFFAGKLETALTCYALSTYLQKNFPDNGKFFKVCAETSLKIIIKSLGGELNLAEFMLFLRELPNLLILPYPIVKELRGVCLYIIPQIMKAMRLNNRWIDYVELDYIWRLLKLL